LAEVEVHQTITFGEGSLRFVTGPVMVASRQRVGATHCIANPSLTTGGEGVPKRYEPHHYEQMNPHVAFFFAVVCTFVIAIFKDSALHHVSRLNQRLAQYNGLREGAFEKHWSLWNGLFQRRSAFPDSACSNRSWSVSSRHRLGSAGVF
jgi:hypothetical protein